MNLNVWKYCKAAYMEVKCFASDTLIPFLDVKLQLVCKQQQMLNSRCMPECGRHSLAHFTSLFVHLFDRWQSPITNMTIDIFFFSLSFCWFYCNMDITVGSTCGALFIICSDIASHSMWSLDTETKRMPR